MRSSRRTVLAAPGLLSLPTATVVCTLVSDELKWMIDAYEEVRAERSAVDVSMQEILSSGGEPADAKARRDWSIATGLRSLDERDEALFERQCLILDQIRHWIPQSRGDLVALAMFVVAWLDEDEFDLPARSDVLRNVSRFGEEH